MSVPLRNGYYYRREIQSINSNAFIDSCGNIYNNTLINTTGKVGINTTKPQYTLDISGSLGIRGKLYDSSGNEGNFGRVLMTTGKGVIWSDPSSVGVNSYWNALGANIYNNNPGYVGIGISSPQYTLDVSGTINMTGSLFVNTNTLYVNSTSNIVGINRYPTYNLDVSGNFRTTNLIDRLDLSGSNGQVLLKDNSGLIWSNKLTDISNSLTTNINKTIDLSNTVTTLSAKVIDISNSLTSNINKTTDLSNTVTTLSAKVTDISNSLTSNINKTTDLSNTVTTLSIRVNDISNSLTSNINKTTDLSNTVTNIYNNLDISNNNINGSFYPIFVSGIGQQRLFIDGSNTQLVYNPGLNRLGIGREPSYNLDISGSLRTTNIVDTDNSSGSIGQVLTSTGTGYKWNNITDVSDFYLPTGNTLIVDAVYGNDTIAATNKYARSFKTITSALSNAIAGELVVINAGTYNETLTIPDNVSIAGTGAQSVIIQKLSVTNDTTLITAGINCRIENFTARLTSSNNVSLIGIRFPTNTSITAKMRNSIWTVQSTYSGDSSKNIIGALSDGSSNLDFTAVNAIQRSSLNVIADSSGSNVRGILVSGANRFACRDIVVYARGNGNNIIGIETTDISAIAEIKTTTIYGKKHDINRHSGEIILGLSDLFHNDCNGNSFSVTQAPATLLYGLIGNLSNNTRYYVSPGTLPIGSINTSGTGSPYSVASSIPFPLIQSSVIIELSLTSTATLGAGVSIIFNIYKNNNTTPELSVTLTSSTSIQTLKESVLFGKNDVMRCTFETVGNPGGTNAAIIAVVGYY
jgi:methyl-accepting chemotaxis protein